MIRTLMPFKTVLFLFALLLAPSVFADDSGTRPPSSLGQSNVADCRYEYDGSEKRTGGELPVESSLRRSSDSSSKTSGSAQ